MIRTRTRSVLAGVSGNLPTTRVANRVHTHEPTTSTSRPVKSDSEPFAATEARVFRSRTGGNEWRRSPKGCHNAIATLTILRDAMLSTRFDRAACTSSRRAAMSTVGRFRRQLGPIVRDLPGAVSVEVQRVMDQGPPPAHRARWRRDDDVTLDIGGKSPAREFSTRSRAHPMCRGLSAITCAKTPTILSFCLPGVLSHECQIPRFPGVARTGPAGRRGLSAARTLTSSRQPVDPIGSSIDVQ